MHNTPPPPGSEEMLYLIATSSKLPPDLHPHIGIMTSPRSRSVHGIHSGRLWGMDCDVFSRKGADPEAQFAFAERLRRFSSTCLFIVVPDTPGNAEATRIIWEHAARMYAELNMPLAYVMHDDSQNEDLPEDADVMFLGGTDPWREQWGAVMLWRARQLNKRTHVGRVNSRRRMQALGMLHAGSADGTHLAFTGRDVGIKDVSGWLNASAQRLFRRDDLTPRPLPKWAVRRTDDSPSSGEVTEPMPLLIDLT